MLDKLALQELSASYQLDPHMESRDNSTIRISGLHECTRKQYYRITNHLKGIPDPPIGSHARVTFEFGHGVHLMMQKRLSNVGSLKWVDADPIVEDGAFGWAGNFEINFFDKDYKLKGHCDALTRPIKRVKKTIDDKEIEVMEVSDDDDPEASRYIIDFKTITAREKPKPKIDPFTQEIIGVETYPSSFEKLTKPKPEHIMQASAYAWLMTRDSFNHDKVRLGATTHSTNEKKKEPLKKIPDVMIVYIAKDLDPKFYERFPGTYPSKDDLLNFPMIAFTEKTNPKTIEKIKDKADKVNGYVERGELPPRDYNYTPANRDFNCEYCTYNRECYAKEKYFSKNSIDYPLRLKYQNKYQLPVLG